MYHNPVMLHEAINGLNITDGGTYADVTFGGGGHSAEILIKLKKGRLIAFDQDEAARQNILDDDRFELVPANFRYLKNYCNMHGIEHLNGILADLGVSSHQFDMAERGFSTRFDSELDMRMDQDQELTASKVLNNYTLEALQQVFSRYGEITNSASLARCIVLERIKEPILKTSRLKEIIKPLVKWGKENQYYAQVFQSLRIEVNNELDALKELLLQCEDMLVTGGRLVIISYHSLEDRLVKNFINKGKFYGEVDKDIYGNELRPFEPVARKAISPSEDELTMNKRSRSAKLRIAEKR